MFSIIFISVRVLASYKAQIGIFHYILAGHLQTDSDPDPAYHFDVDPVPTDPCGSGSQHKL